MVRVKEIKTVKKEDGTEFHCLIVEGDLEPVISNKTGRIYLTKRTAVVPTTLDQEACMATIGTQLDGEVQKVLCDPYNYVLEDGTAIELAHRWEYRDPNLEIVKNHIVEQSQTIM